LGLAFTEGPEKGGEARGEGLAETQMAGEPRPIVPGSGFKARRQKTGAMADRKPHHLVADGPENWGG